jgi:hypothetical protein
MGNGDGMIPNWDNQLIAEFQKVRSEVNRIRDELYSRHPGCACDSQGLCAHHAQVYKRLGTVLEALQKTIQDAQKES